MVVFKRSSDVSETWATPVQNPTDTLDRTTKPVGKSASLDLQATVPKFAFEDIILNPATYNTIQDALSVFDKYDLLFNKWGLGKTHKYQRRATINLYGAPGTGKSMAAHAIAAQLHRKLLIVDYSQIESKYVGETSKNISSLFEYAKSEQCVLFFDEADALLSKRVTNMSHSTDVSVNQTRSHLLLLINEYEDILLFATNFISNYDQAFMRRISAHIKFELPNADNRAKLWQIYIPEGLPTDININELVAKSDGASGADIANAVMQAALRAARQNETIVRSSYFEDAINQIVESKLANNNEETVISRRTVSEEYAKQQLGGGIER